VGGTIENDVVGSFSLCRAGTTERVRSKFAREEVVVEMRAVEANAGTKDGGRPRIAEDIGTSGSWRRQSLEPGAELGFGELLQLSVESKTGQNMWEREPNFNTPFGFEGRCALAEANLGFWCARLERQQILMEEQIMGRVRGKIGIASMRKSKTKALVVDLGR